MVTMYSIKGLKSCAILYFRYFTQKDNKLETLENYNFISHIIYIDYDNSGVLLGRVRD